MPLIKGGRFVDDPFIAIPGDEALPDAPVIVSLERFHKDRDALLARSKPLGVRLKSSENPEQLGDDLPKFAVVALEFPAFRDGRAFSWARLLRTRLNYAGEIRAVGYFLYDQLAYMTRVGVDAFEVRQDFREPDFARALKEMTNVYQPSADGRRTIRELRRDK
jgi:uncharacterized protein (DUF934 family)